MRPRLAEIRILGDGWEVTLLCPGWSPSAVVQELQRMGWHGSVEDDVIRLRTEDNPDVR